MRLNANLIALAILGITTVHGLSADPNNPNWVNPVLKWPPVRKAYQPPSENRLHEKLVHLVIPKFNVHKATLTEAVALLNRLSIQADHASHEGVPFRIEGSQSLPANAKKGPKLTLSLTNNSLAAVTYCIAGLANAKVVEKPNEVVFVTK